MAVTSLSHEELIYAFETTAEGAHGTRDELRDELLRRLSAGNQQAEKVQITNKCAATEHMTAGCQCGPSCMCRGAEPQRSDGRIQGEDAKSEREEFVDWLAHVRREYPLEAMMADRLLEKAQRSAGRIDEGDVQITQCGCSAGTPAHTHARPLEPEIHALGAYREHLRRIGDDYGRAVEAGNPQTLDVPYLARKIEKGDGTSGAMFHGCSTLITWNLTGAVSRYGVT